MKSSWYTFFKSSLQKLTFCPERLRSTFVAEKLLLLCRILPRLVIPEMVVPIKSPAPFLQKAYTLLLLFYYNWAQTTTSLLLSCEKVTQKHFHTAAPLGHQYESAFAPCRGLKTSYWASIQFRELTSKPVSLQYETTH